MSTLPCPIDPSDTPVGLAAPILVNDVHSQLNPTCVDRIVRIDSLDGLRSALRAAAAARRPVCHAGGRHAMGGQQFAGGAMLLDLTGLNRVIAFDDERGLVKMEAGITWPELIATLVAIQEGRYRQWGIRQKQTGADRLTLGGALAANIHGRGLRMGPIVDDVESFVLVDPSGEARRCSREEHRDLFALAIGGYGLFGVIAEVTLRLSPRRKVERRVQLGEVRTLMEAFDRRIAEGFEYGDFQFATDAASPAFLCRGILSCYRPVPNDTPIPPDQQSLTPQDWARLIYLAHHDKPRAFERYARHYLETDGQIYWSDTHQLASYIDDYHAALDRLSGAVHKATEMITEIYVPRGALAPFLAAASEDLRSRGADVIYGTIRLIERDAESVLAWARERWACIVFNLHVVHTPAGIDRAAGTFRALIDLAIAHGGSYYLTYHRWASRAQVEACHPRFREFLALKRQHDPEERFQSDWYRHYRALFAG